MITIRPTLYLIITGAPLTRRADDAVHAASERGWSPVVIATAAADQWIEPNRLRRRSIPLLTGQRSPDEPKRQPQADAVLVAPATFNTVNKAAAGVVDSYPLSVLAEAIGMGTPTIFVPFVNANLAGHPAWPASLSVLRRAGVMIMDPRDGGISDLVPLEPGTGEAVAEEFKWTWPLERLGSEPILQRPR